MSTKKTIQINPELFKLAGNKTKKNRETKEFILKPIVSPNNLKNKLLKRIKEHKINELKNNNEITSLTNETDEFNGAFDYLSGVSKKQKQQRAFNNKTIKTHTSLPITTNPYISLELPSELREPVNLSSFVSPDVLKMHYKSDDIPYGCLKNGHKKTYREWKEQKNPTEQIHLADLVRPPTPPKKNVGLLLEDATAIKTEPSLYQSLTREERLEQIKNKLKKLQEHEASSKITNIANFNIMEKEFIQVGPLDNLPELDDTNLSMPNIDELINQRNEQIEADAPKTYIKKTIKRKFTLGKSDKFKHVTVLIKNKQTRKNIINTQKELKKTNITDVRKYLRQHSLIKVGTTCPPEILRKTFEAAVLAGEVTNINKETLLHNFLNDDTNKS